MQGDTKLLGAVTVGPLILALVASALLYLGHLPSEDYKWIVGSCLIFSVLGYAADRLTFVKAFGVEAKLSELKEATDKAYSTVAELNQLQQQLRDLAVKFGLQQAALIMQANRLVGDDFLSDRVRALKELKSALQNVGVEEAEASLILDKSAQYIRRDLSHDVRGAVWASIVASETNQAQEIKKNNQSFQDDFRQRFILGYEIGTTKQDLISFLTDIGAEFTDDIQLALDRLDAFWGQGNYLSLDREQIITFPNPAA